jgi:hypothetical protein
MARHPSDPGSCLGREEILGLEEILGSNVVASAASKAVNATKKIAGLPLDAVAWALKRTPTPSKSWFIGREEILGHETREQRRARRQRHIQNLKTRAAAGDQQAIAKLQQMQAALSLPSTSPQSTSPYYPPAAPPALPQTNYPTTYPAQSAYAYQSPYYDPSLSQDPYGPPPQPTVDVYQGAEEILGSSFVGDDEREMAREGSWSDREAMSRRVAACGFNGHQAFIRGTSRQPVTKVAGEHHGRRMQKLRTILEPAVQSKKITRANLQLAINTCSRDGDSDSDRLAAAKRLRDFLSAKGVRLEG